MRMRRMRKGVEGLVGRLQFFLGLRWTCKNKVACDGMMCLFFASVTCVRGCHKVEVPISVQISGLHG
jgi:hypothetical protein